MQRSLKCPSCGQTGTVTLEPVPGDSGTQLFVIGLSGQFVRTHEKTAAGQPVVRCDRCHADVAIDRRKAEREPAPAPPIDLAAARRKPTA